jgi:long-chain acyl-CoA synthetase
MVPTVSRLFEDAVQVHKDRVALRMPVPKERRSSRGTQFVLNEVTYGRLGEMVGRLATALRDLGVGRGDRVALVAKPRTAWATSFFAILRCGATVVPLDPELQKNEIERILAEAQVKGVIASGSKIDDLVAIRDAGSLGSVFLVSMDRTTSQSVLFLDALLLGKNILPLVDVAPSDLAILMYTSGTTGNAKGAMLTHANMASNTLTSVKVVELTPEDRFLSIVPWNHIYGLTMTLLCPLITGAASTYTPVDRNLTEVMRKAKPTILLGVKEAV